MRAYAHPDNCPAPRAADGQSAAEILILLPGLRRLGRLRPGRRADLEGRQPRPWTTSYTATPPGHPAPRRCERPRSAATASASGPPWRTPGSPMAPGLCAQIRTYRDLGRGRGDDRPRRVILPRPHRPGRGHRRRPALRRPVPAVGSPEGARDWRVPIVQVEDAIGPPAALAGARGHRRPDRGQRSLEVLDADGIP